MTTKRKLYYHFLNESKTLRYDDKREVVAGKTIKVGCLPILCEQGLHASKRVIDALKYAPGPILTVVTLRGKLTHGNDKSVAQSRTCIWMIDASKLLREFACDVAEIALFTERESGREPDARSWAAIEISRKFMRGEATEQERSAAWSAAESAAWSAARSAAESAAWSAAESEFNDRLMSLLIAEGMPTQ